MTSNGSSPNRLSRTAAKEVPHRKDERFFAAKLEKLIAFLPFYSQSPLYFQQWVNEAEKNIMNAINSLFPTDPETRISILQQAG